MRSAADTLKCVIAAIVCACSRFDLPCPAGTSPDFESIEVSQCPVGAKLALPITDSSSVEVVCNVSQGRKYVCRPRGEEWQLICRPYGVAYISYDKVACQTSDVRTPTENAVVNIKHQLANIGIQDEALTRLSIVDPKSEPPENMDQLRTSARSLGEAMIALEEEDMNYGHIITKWEYGALAFSIAAQYEQETRKRIALADEAVRDARYAAALIAWVTQRASDGEPYYRELSSILVSSDEASRVFYIVALGLAIKSKTSKGSVAPNEVNEALQQVSLTFLRRNPIVGNSWFDGFKR